MPELAHGESRSAWGPGFWAAFVACAVVLAVAVPILNLWVPPNSAVALPDYLERAIDALAAEGLDVDELHVPFGPLAVSPTPAPFDITL